MNDIKIYMLARIIVGCLVVIMIIVEDKAIHTEILQPGYVQTTWRNLAITSASSQLPSLD